MENEDKSIKTENMGDVQEQQKGGVQEQQNNHGFSSHSSGTWNQDEESISTAEKNDPNVKADLPPKINNTKREG